MKRIIVSSLLLIMLLPSLASAVTLLGTICWSHKHKYPTKYIMIYIPKTYIDYNHVQDISTSYQQQIINNGYQQQLNTINYKK